MVRKEEIAMARTEDIGAWLTDIGEEIERIHYDPEGATDKDLENLEKIIEHIVIIERLARATLRKEERQ